MAVKGYIGDSKVSAKLAGGGSIKNGVVYSAPSNLRDRGYPSSIGSSSGSSSANYGVRSTGGSSSGSRSSGGSSGSSSSSADANMANAYNALLAAYNRNDNSNYLDEMRAAAQRAYDRGMNTLNDAYNSQMSSLGSNLGETRSQLASQYNRSRANVNADAENSLRQAYINRMLSQKNLGQMMRAQGLNGGATESTLAGMMNNYGNARNNINTTLNKNLSDLEANYNSSLSQAMQAYNSAVAAANMQKAQQQMSLENALANNQISALGDYQNLMQRENQNYLDLLKSAIAHGASFQYTPTEAINDVNAVAVQQASNPALATNYQALKDLMDLYAGNGNGNSAVTVANPTSNNNYLAAILQQLRG